MGKFEHLRQLALDHLFTPQRPWNVLTAPQGYAIFTGGDGCHVTDISGKTYLDYWGGIQGTVLIGYGRKAVADAAYQQMLELHFAPTHDGSIP